MSTHHKRSRIPAAKVLRSPACFLAFGFGAGLAPVAPGTFGTLVAIPIYLAASTLPLPAYLGLTVALFAAGIWICAECEQVLQVQDHSGIVWDEIVGFLVTMIAVPASLHSILAGFLLFRLFDVWKPWPVRYFDRSVHGGLGIMLDDLLAAVYAWLALTGLIRLGLI